MLSLLVDPEEILDEALQPQTRQGRREEKRDKAKEASKRKKLNQAAQSVSQQKPKPKSKKGARVEGLKKISFDIHCHMVAGTLVLVAENLEHFGTEEMQWFEDGDALVDALARQHNVVNKYRQIFSPTTRYERKVINAALTICELDQLLVIEEKGGWLRLHPLRRADYHWLRNSRLYAA